MKHFNPLPWIVLLSIVLVCVTVMPISITEGMTDIRYVDESEIILTPQSPFYIELKGIDIGSEIIILTDSTLAMNDVVKKYPARIYFLSNFKENTEKYILFLGLTFFLTIPHLILIFKNGNKNINESL